MILPNPGGKVGHRRTHTQKRAPETVPFFAPKRSLNQIIEIRANSAKTLAGPSAAEDDHE
jgi:hypothetical protein